MSRNTGVYSIPASIGAEGRGVGVHRIRSCEPHGWGAVYVGARAGVSSPSFAHASLYSTRALSTDVSLSRPYISFFIFILSFSKKYLRKLVIIPSQARNRSLCSVNRFNRLVMLSSSCWKLGRLSDIRVNVYLLCLHCTHSLNFEGFRLFCSYRERERSGGFRSFLIPSLHTQSTTMFNSMFTALNPHEIAFV